MHRILNKSIFKPIFCLLLIFAFVANRAQADTQNPHSDLCDKFEAQITSCLKGDKIRDAISAVSEYEEAVRACYPAPTYANGLFQSEAEHVSFTCPFDGWTQLTGKHSGVPEWLPSIGVDVTLILTNKKTDDRLAVMSADLKGMSPTPGEAAAGDTERNMTIFANIMGRTFGVQKTSNVLDIGDHRALAVEYAGPDGNAVQMYMLSNGSRLDAFIVFCAQSEKSAMKAKLLSMVKTVDFHYKPTDTIRIAAIRAKVTDANDVKQQLQCVRELTQSGDYGDAGLDLNTLRQVIAGRIPKPVESAGGMQYDTYGITVSNPDSTNWKCGIQMTNGMAMMMLENRTSVALNGMIVGVMDPLVSYGAHADKMVGAGVGEEANKEFLSNAGRGGLLKIGVAIESARYRTFKGMLAYEGIVQMNVPNV